MDAESSTADTSAPQTVLVLGDRALEPDACTLGCDRAGPLAGLHVTFVDEPPAWPCATPPERRGILTVGDVFATPVSSSNYEQSVVTDAVYDPTDLTAIGVAVSQFCEHWGDEYALVVCFDSLDPLLSANTPQAVFRFTHVLLARLVSVGAHAHVHLDPAQCEPRVVDTFARLFDSVTTCSHTDHTVTEATDTEVATLLEAWKHDALPTPTAGPHTDSFQEATDEDIARLLGE